MNRNKATRVHFVAGDGSAGRLLFWLPPQRIDVPVIRWSDVNMVAHTTGMIVALGIDDSAAESAQHLDQHALDVFGAFQLLQVQPSFEIDVRRPDPATHDDAHPFPTRFRLEAVGH